MRYEPSQPLRKLTGHHGVCVVEGYGVRVHLRHGRLHIVDGLPGERRERVYSRVTPGFSRLVVLGHAGTITLEALRWLNDLGIAFVQIDKDGRLVTTSGTGSADARLRRAQALAAGSESGIEITRTILGEKLVGQRDNLERLEAGAELAQAFVAAEARLPEASSLDELVFVERDAALAYWAAWAPVEIRFRKSDLPRLPEHWHRFGRRGSPLTQAPRLAINPINALLNYLYAILEAETRVACLTLGLDPALGIVHADYRSRDSLALDLMETVRPKVDAYVLDLVGERTFKATDFYESPRGICRLLPPNHATSRRDRTRLGAAGRPRRGTRHASSGRDAGFADQAALDATNQQQPPRPARSVAHADPDPSPGPRSRSRPADAAAAKLPHRKRIYCDECLPLPARAIRSAPRVRPQRSNGKLAGAMTPPTATARRVARATSNIIRKRRGAGVGQTARQARRPLRLSARHPPAHPGHPAQPTAAGDRSFAPLRVADPAR